MGITYDIIPLLPGETPDEAVARIYAGGALIIGSDEGLDLVPAETTVPDAPAGALDGWRTEVCRRLAALWDGWTTEEETTEAGRACTYFYSDRYAWQVEVNFEDITIRYAKRSTDADLPFTDGGLLDTFEGLDCILHDPDGMHWIRIEDPDCSDDLHWGIHRSDAPDPDGEEPQ